MLHNYKSIRIIFLSYLLAIVTGAFLLDLKISNVHDITFIDALFTSTSATCVTGLIVKSTQYDFTLFGQAVIAFLIQLGGFGYMSLAILLSMVLGKRLNFKDRLLLKESFDYPTTSGIIKFLRKMVIFMLSIELTGAVFLFLRFHMDFDFKNSLWLAVFHSISAFNNAGFSIFENSIIGYRGDIVINFVLCVLIILGGLGFLTLVELRNYKRNLLERISMHTKIVLIGTAVLLVLGTIMILTFEWNNPKTFEGMSFFEKILVSFFTSTNFRTSGFNSVNIGSLKDTTLFFSTFFMMIGGAPGSTAGGIKITTAAVLLIAAWIFVKNESETVVFNRTIPDETVRKALAILIFAFVYIMISLVTISELESLPFVKIMFEVISAFATVGLSTGDGGVLSLSALFGDSSKIVIILLMFVGRVGVFAFTIALVGRATERKIKFPKGRIVL